MLNVIIVAAQAQMRQKNTKPVAAALRIIMSYFVEFVNSFDSIFFILLVELSQLRWQDKFVLLVEKDDYK